jgi:hypothetical protein
MPDNKWARLLAYVTGLVNQKLLLQNECLIAENRILRKHLPARMRLSDPEGSTLAEIGKRLGRTALQQVACVANPDTILAWYRRLMAHKFRRLQTPRFALLQAGPPIAPEVEALIVRFGRENSGWGYDRIVGALANLGHPISDSDGGKRPSSIRDRSGAQNEARKPPGRISLPPICPSWQAPTSSPWKCSPRADEWCRLVAAAFHSERKTPVVVTEVREQVGISGRSVGCKVWVDASLLGQ